MPQAIVQGGGRYQGGTSKPHGLTGDTAVIDRPMSTGTSQAMRTAILTDSPLFAAGSRSIPTRSARK